MEKMSTLKPAKQARMIAQSQVMPTMSGDALVSSAIKEEVKDHPIITRQNLKTKTSSESVATESPQPLHPKGHKVKVLDEIWKVMDSKEYLHLTDTLVLTDVWLQPKAVESISTSVANVTMLEMIVAPHLKFREASTKMAIDDLCKMLYLSDCVCWDMQGLSRLSFDEWIADKTAAFIKRYGVTDSTNRAKICHFIITDDHDSTFYPTFIKNVGIFFRKICYHSYKKKDGEDTEMKIENPAMIKCCATRGKFEYILEARILPLPIGFWDSIEPDEVPDSQPY